MLNNRNMIRKKIAFLNMIKIRKNQKIECHGPDLNQRHPDLQSGVLPSELPWHMDRTRFELVISSTSKRNHTPRPPVLYNIYYLGKTNI